MWFTSKKIPKEQVESRLFEFKGAVQTCDLNIIKHSLKVLTADLPETIQDSPYFKEVMDFNQHSVLGGLTKNGTGRRILYNSFEKLLNSSKLKKDIKLNEFGKMPHGFSCPINTDLNSVDFNSFWSNASSLKFHLTQSEIESRVQIFSDFILNENYNQDDLTDIKWHKSDLTSDIVSGSEFVGDAPRLKNWEEFSDSIMCFGKLSIDQKNKAIEKFKEMLRSLPYNNFKQ